MIRRLTLGVVVSVGVSSGDSSVAIRARMFRRDTGYHDTDLFNESTEVKLDGLLARVLLVDVVVPTRVAGRRLSVSIKQGELHVVQTWRISMGRVVGAAHQPLLVAPTFCGEPMTITAEIGSLVEART